MNPLCLKIGTFNIIFYLTMHVRDRFYRRTCVSHKKCASLESQMNLIMNCDSPEIHITKENCKGVKVRLPLIVHLVST